MLGGVSLSEVRELRQLVAQHPQYRLLIGATGLASPATVRDALVRGIAVVDPVADEQGPGAGLPP